MDINLYDMCAWIFCDTCATNFELMLPELHIYYTPVWACLGCKQKGFVGDNV